MRKLTTSLCLTLLVFLGSVGESFALPKCSSFVGFRFHNCFGPYTSADGYKYVGEWRNNKYNGQGTLTLADGSKYVGEWRNNYSHGQGTTSYADGTKYVGEYRDGKRNGQGTYTAADGDKYVGEWRNDKPHGQGTYTTADGIKYVGEFRDGKRNGQGTYTAAGGYKYVGEWRNDEKHGQGTHTFETGAIQNQTWSNGQKVSILWVKTHADAAREKKEEAERQARLKKEQAERQARLKKEAERIAREKRETERIAREKREAERIAAEVAQRDELFVAYKRRSQKERKEIQRRLAELELYHSTIDGLFGERTRSGIHAYANSQNLGDVTTPEGAWAVLETLATLPPISTGTQESALPQCPGSGVFHNCFGTWTDDDGDKYVGEWRNDKPHGQGTITYDNGHEFVGEFRDGKRHGQGTYTYADGRVEEGIWENGEFLYAKKLTPTVTENPDKLVTAASGSGFAVSSSGHVITNNHVIYGCSDVKIHHDGNATKATVLAHDPHNDLALLKGNFTPTTVLPLSRDNPQLLQDIYVAGYPFGKKISSSIKVTKGIVSSLTGIGNNVSNIQIDAALQPGNSGGPIIDENGNVVAVAVAKLDLMTAVENWGVVPENTNFGVKSTVVVNLLQSNNVKLRAPNTETVSKTTLGKSMSDATYYLSCWMTMAQIEKLRTEKVMFSSFD